MDFVRQSETTPVRRRALILSKNSTCHWLLGVILLLSAATGWAQAGTFPTPKNEDAGTAVPLETTYTWENDNGITRMTLRNRGTRTALPLAPLTSVMVGRGTRGTWHYSGDVLTAPSHDRMSRSREVMLWSLAVCQAHGQIECPHGASRQQHRASQAHGNRHARGTDCLHAGRLSRLSIRRLLRALPHHSHDGARVDYRDAKRRPRWFCVADGSRTVGSRVAAPRCNAGADCLPLASAARRVPWGGAGQDLRARLSGRTAGADSPGHGGGSLYRHRALGLPDRMCSGGDEPGRGRGADPWHGPGGRTCDVGPCRRRRQARRRRPAGNRTLPSSCR